MFDNDWNILYWNHSNQNYVVSCVSFKLLRRGGSQLKESQVYPVEYGRKFHQLHCEWVAPRLPIEVVSVIWTGSNIWACCSKYEQLWMICGTCFHLSSPQGKTCRRTSWDSVWQWHGRFCYCQTLSQTRNFDTDWWSSYGSSFWHTLTRSKSMLWS